MVTTSPPPHVGSPFPHFVLEAGDGVFHFTTASIIQSSEIKRSASSVIAGRSRSIYEKVEMMLMPPTRLQLIISFKRFNEGKKKTITASFDCFTDQMKE